MCSERPSAIVHAAWSRKTHIYKVWLPAECIACALSMLSIHSPDYVFTVLVSIFMKTHNHFWAPAQRYKYVFIAVYVVRVVVEFSASITCACALQTVRTWGTYHIQTYLRLQHYVSALRCIYIYKQAVKAFKHYVGARSHSPQLQFQCGVQCSCLVGKSSQCIALFPHCWVKSVNEIISCGVKLVESKVSE